MRSFFTGIIATTHLWERVQPLISSLENLPTNIYISKPEPKRTIIDPSYRRLWFEYLSDLFLPLISNYLLSNGIYPTDEILSSYTDTSTFPWLQPRPLNCAEISLYHKHISLLHHFIKSSYDYMLIMEDDLIIKKSAFSSIQEIIDNCYFSYADLAGGCNLTLKGYRSSSYTSPSNKFSTYIVPWNTSRTTCCCIVSRQFAYQFLFSDIYHYVLPIDWIYSLVLQRNPHQACLWVEDLEMLHGSKQGFYKSSIS
jgi:GR25 family glycosyltransferase involved in LPS biosynthesis